MHCQIAILVKEGLLFIVNNDSECPQNNKHYSTVLLFAFIFFFGSGEISICTYWNMFIS